MNVTVGEVLELRRRRVDVEPTETYREIGIRSFGRGIFHKPPVTGSELGNKRVFEIEPGDLVLSNVFAWEGAVAMAGNDESGRIGSHRFLTYVPREGGVSVPYLRYFFMSEVGRNLLAAASPGSAGRNRTLSIDRFEALQVPLPGMDEQQRIAERFDRISNRIDRLTALRIDARRIGRALGAAAANRSDLTIRQKQAAGWSLTTLADVLTPASDKVQVEADASYPNVGVLSFGRGLFEKSPIDGSSTSAKTLFRIRDGQFIYSRLFAFEGAYTYVEPRFDGFFVSNEFPTFDIDPERLDVVFLAAYFSAPAVWSELARSSKGLGLRRQRVQPDAILATSVWLPPLGEQQRIRSVVERAQTIARLRHDTTKHVNALFPAVLSSTFT